MLALRAPVTALLPRCLCGCSLGPGGASRMAGLCARLLLPLPLLACGGVMAGIGRGDDECDIPCASKLEYGSAPMPIRCCCDGDCSRDRAIGVRELGVRLCGVRLAPPCAAVCCCCCRCGDGPPYDPIRRGCSHIEQMELDGGFIRVHALQDHSATGDAWSAGARGGAARATPETAWLGGRGGCCCCCCCCTSARAFAFAGCECGLSGCSMSKGFPAAIGGDGCRCGGGLCCGCGCGGSGFVATG